MRSHVVRARLRVLRASLAVAGALVIGLIACRPDTGPQEIAWNRQACEQCRMLIGEPAFAAQLRTTSGSRSFFDDPGCLLLYHAERPELDVAERWFHHVHEDRWIPADRVALVPTERATPMGYGLAAVEQGAGVEGLSLDEALAQVQRVEAERRGR